MSLQTTAFNTNLYRAHQILCQITTIGFKQKQFYCLDQTLPLILHGTSYRSKVNHSLSDESTIFHILKSEFVIRRSILNFTNGLLAFTNSRHTIQAQNLQQNIVSIQSPVFSSSSSGIHVIRLRASRPLPKPPICLSHHRLQRSWRQTNKHDKHRE